VISQVFFLYDLKIILKQDKKLVAGSTSFAKRKRANAVPPALFIFPPPPPLMSATLQEKEKDSLQDSRL